MLLVAPGAVGAPARGLRALLGVAAGQLGPRTTGRRQLAAGLLGAAEAALGAGAVLLVPGLRRAGPLLVLRLAGAALLVLLALLVLRGERVRSRLFWPGEAGAPWPSRFG
ncbi:hypothetical protein SMICM304S_03601 [Streptomyces microflavus]